MSQRWDGFSLMELLLALSLGLTLLAVIGKALTGELGQSRWLAHILRERMATQRALELMRMELQEAPVVRVMPGVIQREGCGLAGRKVLLHLDFTPDGVLPDQDVTYSLERKPDPIWRGQVLMRCGPAYGLEGQLENSVAVSRVWLDALHADGMTIVPVENGRLKLSLSRVFLQPSGERYQMNTVVTIPVPVIL